MPDNGKHSIVFDGHSIWRCSEPKEIKVSNIEDVLRGLRDDVRDRKQPLGEEVAQWESRLDSARMAEYKTGAYNELTAIDSPDFEQVSSPRDIPAFRKPQEEDPHRLALQRVADRAKIEFDAQLFVVQEAD